MPMDMKALGEEFAQAHTQCNSLVEKVAGEKRAMTAEERQEQDKRFARMDEIKGVVEESKRLAAMSINFGADGPPKGQQPKGMQAIAAAAAAAAKSAKGEEFTVEQEREAINEFLRTGRLDEERFTLISTSGSSVYLPRRVLPNAQVRRPANAIRNALAAYGFNPIETATTEKVAIPLDDDTSNTGAALTESQATETAAVDPTPTEIDLPATLYESKPSWFSNTLVLANTFDILQFVQPRLQRRVDKAQEAAWSTQLKAGTTGKTAAGVAAITYAELLDWEHSIPVAYREGLAFILADGLYRLLRGLVDSQARPIMDLDPVNLFQERIHGKPIFVSDQYSTPATGVKSGSLVATPFLYIRDVIPQRMTRYVNVPTRPDQVGFNLFANGGFGFEPSAVRNFVQA